MKKLKSIVLSFTVFSFFVLAACDNASQTEAAQERVEEEQGDLQEAREDLSEQIAREKVELQTEIRNAQNRVDRRLTELRAELNDAEGDARAALTQRIERLEERREQLDDDLDRVDNTMQDEWENFKMSIRTNLNDLDGDLN